MILALSTPFAVAQDESPAFDPYPLRPTDTSSPRDTLRSFNVGMKETIQAWRDGESREVVHKSAQRAFDTFDSVNCEPSDEPEKRLRLLCS